MGLIVRAEVKGKSNDNTKKVEIKLTNSLITSLDGSSDASLLKDIPAGKAKGKGERMKSIQELRAEAVQAQSQVEQFKNDTAVTEVAGDFREGRSLANIDALAHELTGKKLDHLYLNLDCCDSLSNIDELARSLQGMPLKQLKLYLSGCHLSNIDALGQSSGGMRLTKLFLHYYYCSALSNIDELGRALTGMPLTSLYLFRYSNISNSNELGCSLVGMPLDSLQIVFESCSNLRNIDQLALALKGMPLTSLTLIFGYTAVANIEQLARYQGNAAA